MTTRTYRRHWKVGTQVQVKSPELFKAFMESRGLSVRELARVAGCKHAMIGHLRTGYKTSTAPELSARIADALRVPLDLLYEVEQPTTLRSAAA